MRVARWAALWAALILLPCTPVFAQGQYERDGASEDQYEADVGTETGDAECPGAVEVDTITGTGNRETRAYGFEGESLRLTATAERRGNGTGQPFLLVSVNRENGTPVSSFSVEREGTESTVVNAAPGSFFLDISTVDTSYEIVVEDCRGGDDAGDNDDGNDDGNENADDEGDVDDPDDVMAGTGDKGPLPNTGGVPLALGAGGLLLAASLAVRRIVAP